MQNALANESARLPVNEPSDGAPRLWAVQDNWNPVCGTVKALISDEKYTLHPNALVTDAAEVMERLDLGHLPVVSEEGPLVGLLTHTCVARVVSHGVDDGTANKTVGDIMITDPVTVTSETSIIKTLTILRDNEFRYLLVVDDQGAVEGVVSARDVMRVASRLLEDQLKKQL
jgi:CBS domain-containing protein